MGDKHKDTTGTENIICPHCGYEYIPCLRDNKETYWDDICDKCGGKYTATVDYIVTFSTWKRSEYD